MLPIFFLAFACICQLPTTAAVHPVPSRPLLYYDADSKQDVKVIKEWYNMVKGPLDEKTSSLDQLVKEAMDAREMDSHDSVMYWYLNNANETKRCVDVPVFGVLTRAECLVVVMYTLGGSKPFHSEYNEVSANKTWQPFKVYTTLLMSALQKLAKIDLTFQNRVIYRGINFTAERPNAERIFFKAFTSTSLDLNIARKFAGPKGMILEFHPPHSRYAAPVRNLSSFLDEEEVLLPPFIAFDVLNADGSDSEFKFNTSAVQEILPHIPQRETISASNVGLPSRACLWLNQCFLFCTFIRLI